MKESLLQSPFPRQAFQYLAAQESRHWWFRARNRIILWVLRRKVSGIFNFIEVGCGTGFVIGDIARAFPSLHLEASEYFEDGLVLAASACLLVLFASLMPRR